MRLNETVGDLDRIKKKFAEVDVKAEQLARELTNAKSDCKCHGRVGVLSDGRANESDVQ